MRLLLQLSLAAADDGTLLERADDGSSIMQWRMLFVKRVVHRRRRAIRSRGLRHWFVWMLCGRALYASDGLADCHADSRANGRTDDRTICVAIADAHVRAIGLADSAANVDSDSCADSDADRDADSCAVVAAITLAHVRAIDLADGAPNIVPDDSPDVLTNPTAVDGGVHDCIRYAGGNVRKRTWRQLLRKRSHVRG